MKAIVCHEFGPIETLAHEDLPDPVAGPGQVVIDIHAAGVNFPDGLMVRGEYQMKPDRPFIPGGELAGTIRSLGDGVTSHAIGDRVVALSQTGAFAERIAVQAGQALKLPAAMDFPTAAGFMLVYGTSYHALVNRAELHAGQTLLVLGAAGGVGLAAVEIGAALGAHVIAAASTDEKLELARAHGATTLINYTSTDLKTELKRLFPNGVDVAYDPVGGAHTEAAVRGLAWRGRLLVIGFAAGDIPRLPLNLLLLREAQAMGVFWGTYARRDPASHTKDVAQPMSWHAEGKLRPHISNIYPLAKAADALRDVMGRQAMGKVIISAK